MAVLGSAVPCAEWNAPIKMKCVSRIRCRELSADEAVRLINIRGSDGLHVKVSST